MIHRTAFLHAGLAAALLAAPLCLADEVTIEPSRDATLYENMAGDSANGSGEWFFIGRNGVGLIRRALIHFDVAGAVPAGATIDEVSLTLYMSQTQANAFPGVIHRALAHWGEGPTNPGGNEGGGMPAADGDSTWLYRFFDASAPTTSPAWANPGGDFTPATVASTVVAGEGQYYTWTSPEMAADVQAWLDDPATNYGWLMRGDEVAFERSSKRFDSRTNPIVAQRPALRIVYSLDADCPADIAEPFGVLDLADVQAFIAGFLATDPIADLAPPDGVWDLADVQAFIASFNAGCP